MTKAELKASLKIIGYKEGYKDKLIDPTHSTIIYLDLISEEVIEIFLIGRAHKKMHTDNVLDYILNEERK